MADKNIITYLNWKNLENVSKKFKNNWKNKYDMFLEEKRYVKNILKRLMKKILDKEGY